VESDNKDLVFGQVPPIASVLFQTKFPSSLLPFGSDKSRSNVSVISKYYDKD
jgi:hypothetical protein